MTSAATSSSSSIGPRRNAIGLFWKRRIRIFLALTVFLCAVFAKNTRHVAAWEDENENDYVDLLAEVDENAGNEHDYATSDIAAQFDHEITVRGASSGTEKVVSRTIDFI